MEKSEKEKKRRKPLRRKFSPHPKTHFKAFVDTNGQIQTLQVWAHQISQKRLLPLHGKWELLLTYVMAPHV